MEQSCVLTTRGEKPLLDYAQAIVRKLCVNMDRAEGGSGPIQSTAKSQTPNGSKLKRRSPSATSPWFRKRFGPSPQQGYLGAKPKAEGIADILLEMEEQRE